MLDTTSFAAFRRSLNLTGPVTDRGGSMVAGPPVWLAEIGLRLGLGPAFMDTPQSRSILRNLDLDPALLQPLTRKIRVLPDWRAAWEDLAAVELKKVEAAMARADRPAALAAINTALTMLSLAYSGDGHYFYTPYSDRPAIWPTLARLREQWRTLHGERVERLSIPHARGTTTGLLHLPPGAAGPRPALLGLHQLGGDADDFDFTLQLFRAAGFATLCIDLPAQGSNFAGPRLQADDEQVALAALEILAARPEVDARRIAVVGGSLGGFYALRTAAAAGPRVRACLAYASAFDVASGLPQAVRGIRETFAWVIGARDYAETLALAQPFHLRAGLERIQCPIRLVHGTQDHICDFTVPFEIARRVTVPLSVIPIPGADHEVAIPAAPHLAGPGIAWLKEVLADD